MSHGSSFDQAQLCLNGHFINSTTQRSPEDNQAYCDKCGANTIDSCPSCRKPIRGMSFSNSIILFAPPQFCQYCGAAFPWLAARIAAALAIAADANTLNDEDRADLDQTIRDIASDTPQATSSALKFKRLLAKAGKETAGLFRSVLTDVISETAKKVLLP